MARAEVFPQICAGKLKALDLSFLQHNLFRLIFFTRQNFARLDKQKVLADKQNSFTETFQTESSLILIDDSAGRGNEVTQWCPIDPPFGPLQKTATLNLTSSLPTQD